MPSLINSPISIKKEINELDIPKRINLDPIAWNNKYFKADSDSWIQKEEEIIGIKEIIFNSSAIQTISQWKEETIIRVLINKVDKKRDINGYISIKERKELNLSS